MTKASPHRSGGKSVADPGSGSVRAVGRALNILRAFTPTAPVLSLGDIARRAQLDKSTTHRLLVTLMNERVVEQSTETKDYSLSLGVLELAAGLKARDDLGALARPVLAALAQETGATAFLGVVRDGSGLCLARVDGNELIQVRFWSIGGRMTLHCGAGPRVLLAHMPPADIDRYLAGPLEALTPRSPCDPVALSAILARIRERDWELAEDDIVEGIVSLGVPVRDRSGAVLAAISISGLRAHFIEGSQPRHLPALQEKARDLERAIG